MWFFLICCRRSKNGKDIASRVAWFRRQVAPFIESIDLAHGFFQVLDTLDLAVFVTADLQSLLEPRSMAARRVLLRIKPPEGSG
jgi:hypothetical protein